LHMPTGVLCSVRGRCIPLFVWALRAIEPNRVSAGEGAAWLACGAWYRHALLVVCRPQTL
jgi:hypothetical protein